MRPLLAILAILLLAATLAWAQATTPPPSCEQQLDSAQRAIIQLRKQVAQAEFQNATLQEQILDQQRKK